MSELMEAIQSGDAGTVKALVSEDRSLLTRQENAITPVLFALYHGQTEISRLLIDLGAPLSFPEACAVGDAAAVHSALAEDPAIRDTRSADGFPALGLAIFFRQPAVARRLIEAGADVNAQAANALRVAPVHAAAGVCDHETMRMLLEHGADPNARQQLDYTALHGAASRGDIGLAEMLLEHGADPAACGSDGATVADVARKYGRTEFAEWFEGRTDARRP